MSLMSPHKLIKLIKLINLLNSLNSLNLHSNYRFLTIHDVNARTRNALHTTACEIVNGCGLVNACRLNGCVDTRHLCTIV